MEQRKKIRIDLLRSLAAHLALVACMVGASANASISTIDPDDFAPGTNLSLEQLQGVSLETFSSPGDGSYVFSSVYAGHDPSCINDPFECDAVTGTSGFSPIDDGFRGSRGWSAVFDAGQCFTRLLDGQCGGGFGPFSALLISLHEPVDYVEISGTFLSDWPMLVLFDAERNLLGHTDYPANVLQRESAGTHRYNLATAQGNAPNIAYALAGSWSSNSSLDVLRFGRVTHVVPEPGSLILLGIGLLGLRFAHRRNRQQKPVA